MNYILLIYIFLSTLIAHWCWLILELNNAKTVDESFDGF